MLIVVRADRTAGADVDFRMRAAPENVSRLQFAFIHVMDGKAQTGQRTVHGGRGERHVSHVIAGFLQRVEHERRAVHVRIESAVLLAVANALVFGHLQRLIDVSGRVGRRRDGRTVAFG